nr:MAG TPA: tail completion protein [Caudoviricetes sp.]
MIELLDVKKSCNAALKVAFPDFKIYGTDVREGLKLPSFYTEIVPYTLNYESLNLVRQTCGYKITLLEKTPNEELELSVFEKIRKAFHLKVRIKDKLVTVESVEFDYIGAENNIFQITVHFQWFDSIAVEKKEETVKELIVRGVENE